MKKLLLLMISVVLVFSLAACSVSSNPPAPIDSSTPSSEPNNESTPEGEKSVVEAIKAKGKLVMGTEATYAPFEFLDENAKFAGCDIWLGEQIAAELGVELEVMDMAFDGIIPAVKAGQVDLGIAAFTVTEERALEIDFSEIYQHNLQMLVVKKGDENKYTSADSLKGLQVGAQRGTIQSKLIETALPESKLFELDKYPALALEVANGNIAGLVVDDAVGQGLIDNNTNLVKANFEFDSAVNKFGKAATLKKGNTELMEVVNKVIKRVVEDGSFEVVYNESVEKAKSLGI